MATARETMFEEIAAMAESPIGDDAVDQVNKMMARYRVQTKPGTDVGEGLTARDALGIELIDLWRAGGDAMHEKMQETIGRYRMQSKGSGKPDGKAKSKKAAKPALRKQAVAPTTPATPLPAAAARPSPAPRPRTPRIEPVAGGPRKRGKTRSECPKCHSMGGGARAFVRWRRIFFVHLLRMAGVQARRRKRSRSVVGGAPTWPNRLQVARQATRLRGDVSPKTPSLVDGFFGSTAFNFCSRSAGANAHFFGQPR